MRIEREGLDYDIAILYSNRWYNPKLEVNFLSWDEPREFDISEGDALFLEHANSEEIDQFIEDKLVD